MAVPSCIISGLDCVSITVTENDVSNASHFWLVKIKGVPSTQGREGGTTRLKEMERACPGRYKMRTGGEGTDNPEERHG